MVHTNEMNTNVFGQSLAWTDWVSPPVIEPPRHSHGITATTNGSVIIVLLLIVQMALLQC